VSISAKDGGLAMAIGGRHGIVASGLAGALLPVRTPAERRLRPKQMALLLLARLAEPGELTV
jgi:hypothetical protein